MMEHCCEVTPTSAADSSFVSSSLPPSLLMPIRGRCSAEIPPMPPHPCQLLHCGTAVFVRLIWCLSCVYPQGGHVRIGTSRMHTVHRPHPLPNLPPTPLSATALTLPLCLNGRKEALRVGNGLHQTLRGSERRMTGIQRECERERRSREEARRVWWGGGDQRRRGGL